MKLRITKFLLQGLFAASSVTAVQGATTPAQISTYGTHSPVDIIAVEAGEEVAIESDSVEAKPAVYAVIVKDGQGTATVTGDITKYHALLVREGEVEIGDGVTDSSLTITVPTFSGSQNYRTGISVAGKNAQVTVNKAELSFRTSETQLSVGGGSGSGTFTLDNGAVANFSLSHLVTIGGMYWVDGSYETKQSDTVYRGNYITSPIDNKTLLGKGVINVQGASTLSVGNGMGCDYGSAWMGEGELNVTGVGSSATFYAKNGGYRFIMNEDTMSTSSINVKEGASSIINTGLFYTNFRANTVANITVDGTDADGNASKLVIGNTTSKNDNKGTYIATRDLENTVANITVTNGGQIVFDSQETIMSSAATPGKVYLTVDGESSATFRNVTANTGTTIKNSGSMTMEKLTVRGGLIENSGSINALEMIIADGAYIGKGASAQFGCRDLTVLEGAVVEGLTMTTGTVSIDGKVSFTNVTFGTVLNVASLMSLSSEGDALTVYIAQGSTINADNLTIGSGTSVAVVLDEGVIYEQNAPSVLFTVTGSDTEKVAALESALGNNLTVYNDGNTEGEGTIVKDATGSIATTVVPEPATATLSLLALCGLAARRRRK